MLYWLMQTRIRSKYSNCVACLGTFYFARQERSWFLKNGQNLKLSCHPVKWFKPVTVLVAVLGCNKTAAFALIEARVNPALRRSCRLLLLSTSPTPNHGYVLFVRRHSHREVMHIFWADRLQVSRDLSCCIYRIVIASQLLQCVTASSLSNMHF